RGDVLAGAARTGAHHAVAGDPRAGVDAKDQGHVANCLFIQSTSIRGPSGAVTRPGERLPTKKPEAPGRQLPAWRPARGSVQLVHDLVGDLGVVVDVLHVVQVLQ